MKCSNCGCEIGEGHLYCEKCGMEIQIVPDFEPEIENSITETLTTVAEEIEDGTAGGKTTQQKEQNISSQGAQAQEVSGRSRLIVGLITLGILAVIISAGAVFFYHRYSVDYQLSQAEKYAQAGDYQEAVSYMEKARSLGTGNFSMLMQEVGYYQQLQDEQSAAKLLLELVEKYPLEYEEKEIAYGNLLTIYDQEGRYEDINRVLLQSKDEGIMLRFQQYMALTPEFNYEAGSYDEVIPLKMVANTTGRIYYTLDGTEPNERSQVYTTPLLLESGEYQISAVFINDYGIRSQVARSWYLINLSVPEAPEIPLSSGEYHFPTMIEVTAKEGEMIYYTTDGTEPNEGSMVYAGPIKMPLGHSNFKFAVISPEGVSSEVISRSFHFYMETDVTVNKAVENVIQALYNRKVLTDLQGHSHEIKGKYVFEYDTIVEIPDMGYYYVLKESVEENGVRTGTGRLYAVEVYTGAPNRLIYDENGNMGLISLES